MLYTEAIEEGYGGGDGGCGTLLARHSPQSFVNSPRDQSRLRVSDAHLGIVSGVRCGDHVPTASSNK